MSAKDPSGHPDPRLVRAGRARHAPAYDTSDRLPRVLAEHLMEHLEPIRRTPGRVLELGSATGHLRRLLLRRYPRASVLSSDDCLALLGRSRPHRWPFRQAPRVCAAADRLPLPAASVDMLVCNLALLRVDRLSTALTEWRRVLRHDGLLMLATLGPLSFAELREAWAAVDRAPHLHPFPDLHEVGDALVHAGFHDVVMDAERLRMEFDDLAHMLRELRAVSGGNALPGRRRALTTPRTLARLAEHYVRIAPPPGCWATVEAVYAHGWVVEREGVPVAPPRLGA